MSPRALRIIGVAFLTAAAAVAVLNLKRAAGPGAVALPSALFVLGVAFVLRAKKRRL